MPGCYDALSAAIVQKSGRLQRRFHLRLRPLRLPPRQTPTSASSRILSSSPSSPPEMGETARSVCAAAPLIPIIADADTGGGNALNVQRTVQDLIAAGAAGCFFEVIPAEEHAAKIASARDIIGDSDFFLVARTDARANSAKSEAIAHANLYMEAGADACFVEAPRDDDELKEWQELKEMGVHLIVHPLTTLYASACALIDVLKVLKDEGTTRDQLCKLATFEEFNELIGLESWFELEARYSKFKSPVGAEL